MAATDILRAALARGQAALSEFESKQVLGEFGLPISREGLAGNADEACTLAAELGFPVVLKACSSRLMHKSEGGWVRLNLKDEPEVRAAFADIQSRAAGEEIDGVLVQEMVPGQRELVLGLNRDPQFGPCVMLGLGGIMTEIFRDVVFRMAPFDSLEASDMVAELRSRALLDDFRGQAPADLEAVTRSLVALGRLGLQLPEVAEVDVNPMIITPEGRVVAVDALVVLRRADND